MGHTPTFRWTPFSFDFGTHSLWLPNFQCVSEAHSKYKQFPTRFSMHHFLNYIPASGQRQIIQSKITVTITSSWLHLSTLSRRRIKITFSQLCLVVGHIHIASSKVSIVRVTRNDQLSLKIINLQSHGCCGYQQLIFSVTVRNVCEHSVSVYGLVI